MRWPPPDTDRNRFLFRLGAVLAVLAAAYFLAFALVSDGVVPWTVFTLLVAGTVVLGAGLLLMRAERRGARGSGPSADAGPGPGGRASV